MKFKCCVCFKEGTVPVIYSGSWFCSSDCLRAFMKMVAIQTQGIMSSAVNSMRQSHE